jgi:glutamate racemase
MTSLLNKVSRNGYNNSIGFFDSGIGGTSIWKEVHELLPNENTIFLADSKNAPYGTKSKEEIINLSIKNTEFLLNENCKLIVVACNTATTNAISYLRQTYKVPFIGIEPAIKPAALKTKTNTIGILATQGTLSSELFNITSDIYTSGINVIEQNGDGIVHLIETGKLYSKEMELLLEKYLTPMVNKNIDYLVLGCTHYPYLIPVIQKIIPQNIKIIDSGEAVAKQTKAVLTNADLFSLGDNTKQDSIFYTNKNAELLASFLPQTPTVKVDFLDF